MSDWISVEDNPPEENEYIIVWGKGEPLAPVWMDGMGNLVTPYGMFMGKPEWYMRVLPPEQDNE